jgi:hypothetical protein
VEPAEPQVDASGDYVRTPIPAAAVLTEDKDLVLLSTVSESAAQLLVFLSPGCGPCRRIGPLVAEWDELLGPVVVRAVVAGQPEVVDSSLPFLKGHAWFDPYGLARKQFGAGNPSAVLLGTDGHLAGGPVHGEDAVREFVADIGERLREAREAGELPVPGAEREEPADDEPLAVSAEHAPAASVIDDR